MQERREMFKKFNPEEHVSTTSSVKNSVTRAIQSQISELYPTLAPVIDDILPKKKLSVAKCQEHVQITLVDSAPMFFNQRDGPFLPHLRFLHKYPKFMKYMKADKGAVPFILSGANIMAPGFTSAGGDIPQELEVGEPVAIFAEGKESPLAVGIMKMSTEDMRKTNKGIAVENCHFLTDGLWVTSRID